MATRRLGLAIVALSALVLISWALRRLDAHVGQTLIAQAEQPTVSFVDCPRELAGLALVDLRESVNDLLEAWMGDDVCELMAKRLERVGWISSIHFVRRSGTGTFQVSGRYRTPRALVTHDGAFWLVDDEGVRLPGVYQYEANWPLITGVAAVVPAIGEAWSGEDLQGGLAVVRAIETEPYRSQIVNISIENYGGRRDPWASHIVLETDLGSGGMIRWGSAPGHELEENSASQKLAILRANYRETGRVDAQRPVIDIATLPDRYTVPG